MSTENNTREGLIGAEGPLLDTSVGDAQLPIVNYVVGKKRSGRWPALRITVEVMSEHDTVSEAADACVKARRG